MTSMLRPAQSRVVDEERHLIRLLRDLLQAWETQDEALAHLDHALEVLEELFLLVVTGEFNSGKSALINALLGEALLEEGVTPTTHTVQVLVRGVGAAPRLKDGYWVREIDSPLLEDMHIVDTPGTNAILRQHEALTRDFVPRADLVIFVTSADRPFSESERAFLEMIREWGKKIVFVVNKVDLLESDAERQEVLRFVENAARRLLGEPPPVFSVSARLALRARAAGDDARYAESGWPKFEVWLRESLTAGERLKLKLANPLGVAQKLRGEARHRAGEQLGILEADELALRDVARGIVRYDESMRSAFAQRLDAIDNHLHALRERGEEFLDDRFRLTNVRQLLDSEGMRRGFEDEVVGAAPADIEADVHRTIDWIVDLEHAQWQAIRAVLVDRSHPASVQRSAQAATGFAARRRDLLESIGQQSDDVVASFDPAAEGGRIAYEVQDALARTALVEVGAVGLGLILKAVLASAAADATGLLAAGLLAVLGLTLIPHRRQRAAAALRERVGEVQSELHSALSSAFSTELEAAVHRMQETIRPYEEFLSTERDELLSVIGQLDEIGAGFARLRSLIDELDAAAPSG